MKKLLFFNFSILCAAMLLTSNTMQAALGLARRQAVRLGQATVLQAEQRAAAPTAGRLCRTVCTDPSGTFSPGVGLEERFKNLAAAERELLEAQENTKQSIEKTNEKAENQKIELEQRMNDLETAYEAEKAQTEYIKQKWSETEPLKEKFDQAKKERDLARTNRFKNRPQTEADFFNTENEEEEAKKILDRASDQLTRAQYKVLKLQQQEKLTPKIHAARVALQETMRNPSNLINEYVNTEYAELELLESYIASVKKELDTRPQQEKLYLKQKEAEKAAQVIAALELVRDHPEFNQLEPDVQEGILTEIDKLGTTINI